MPQFQFNDSVSRPLTCPEGDYILTLLSYEFSMAQNSGNELMELKFETEGGVLVYDNLVFTEKAFWKIDTCFKAFFPSKGVPLPKKHSMVNIDEKLGDLMKGMRGWATLGQEKDNKGRTRMRIANYLTDPPAGQAMPKADVTPTTKVNHATAPAPAAVADEVPRF